MTCWLVKIITPWSRNNNWNALKIASKKNLPTNHDFHVLASLPILLSTDCTAHLTMKYVFGEIYHMQMERDALPPAHIQPLEGGGGGGDFKRALNYAITTFSFSPSSLHDHVVGSSSKRALPCKWSRGSFPAFAIFNIFSARKDDSINPQCCICILQ